MRISDWSSDVCSSDLHKWRGGHMDMQGGGFGAGDLTAAQHVRLAGGGVAAPVAPVTNHHRDELMIGEVVDISGSASRILLDSTAIGKLASSNRSEERRVGQECVCTCSSRW